jgi:hypothetical protein
MFVALYVQDRHIPIQLHLLVMNMMNDQMRIVKIQWSFKDYHHFHIRPSVGINLQVENEDNNPPDPYAVRVVVPRILSTLLDYR